MQTLSHMSDLILQTLDRPTVTVMTFRVKVIAMVFVKALWRKRHVQRWQEASECPKDSSPSTESGTFLTYIIQTTSSKFFLAA